MYNILTCHDVADLCTCIQHDGGLKQIHHKPKQVEFGLKPTVSYAYIVVFLTAYAMFYRARLA